MSKQTVTPENILAGTPDQGVDLQQQLVLEQLAFQRLQRKRLEKQDAEEQEQEAQKMKARLESAQALEKARLEQVELQKACPHQKPNGQSAVGGQRDHNHNYILLCAYCQKLFDGNTLPPHLRVDAQKIGGPN